MISIELDREDKLTIAQWEGFLAMARQAGASDDTPVAEVTVPQDESIVACWRVEVTEPQGAASGNRVSLPAWLVHDLLSVAREVAYGDGDVRGMEDGARTVVQRTYDHLLLPVLGENPYDERNKDDAGDQGQPE